MLLSRFDQKCAPQKDLWPFIKKMDIWFLSGGMSDIGGVVVTEDIELLRQEFTMRTMGVLDRSVERTLQASYTIAVKSFQMVFGSNNCEFYPVIKITIGAFTYNYVIDRMTMTSGLVLVDDDCLRFFYDDEFNPAIIKEQIRKQVNKGGAALNPYVQEEYRLRGKSAGA